MTKELFWQDAYMKSCICHIESVENERFVVLNQCIFFPQGGGQPSDYGTIKCNGVEYKVVGAKKAGEKISVEVDKAGLKADDRVECELDWKRRYRLMRMHTSAHVLSQVIFLEIGSLSAGNQIDEKQSRMDFNVKEFSREIAQSFIDKANKVIERGLEVKSEFIESEKALQRPELFKLKDVAPKNIPVLRIVSVGDFDVQADGGTHVKNTREIGKLKLVKTENKGKENRRIYWELEG